MKLFIDVTSSRRSMQSAGMHRITKIFAELIRPADVRPIYRNTLDNFYADLGKASRPQRGVIGRFRIADYNQISSLNYKLL